MIQIKKINIKDNKGFTMADLVIALAVFSVFAGIIGTLMYSAFKINLQTKMAGTATNYAIQILEDIDKITYEEVVNGMESHYISKFSIPSGFSLNIDVTNYNEIYNKEDLIKQVDLKVTYYFAGRDETIRIQKLKVKEI